MLRNLSILASVMLVALSASPSRAESARLLSARSGERPGGITRVVFVVDRPVDPLTVELSAENGFEVHLLDVDGSSLPEPLSPRTGLIGKVSFRSSPTGITVRLSDAPVRLSATTFPLTNPHRVVVDLRPSSSLDSGEIAGTAKKTAPARPAPAVTGPEPARPGTPDAEPDADPEMERLADRAVAAINSAVAKLTGGRNATDGPATDDAPTPAPRAPATADPAAAEAPEDDGASLLFKRPGVATKRDGAGVDEDDPESLPGLAGEEGFEDLLVWIHVLQNSVKALNEAEEPADRVRYRLRLGHLLVQRGILVEGEKLLASAVADEDRDRETVVADSLTLGEVRLAMGNEEGAAEIARNLDAGRATPDERLRIAAVLLDAGHPVLAGTLLESTVKGVGPALESRARLLLARSHWDRGNAGSARDAILPVTTSPEASRELLPDAVLLHADCEFALGRNAEAQALYVRATTLDLGDEDASWAGLQLGNLARRAGRHADARNHWKTTNETWPDTFYGTQAAWFLRFAEDLHELSQVTAENPRG